MKVELEIDFKVSTWKRAIATVDESDVDRIIAAIKSSETFSDAAEKVNVDFHSVHEICDFEEDVSVSENGGSPTLELKVDGVSICYNIEGDDDVEIN